VGRPGNGKAKVYANSGQTIFRINATPKTRTQDFDGMPGRVCIRVVASLRDAYAALVRTAYAHLGKTMKTKTTSTALLAVALLLLTGVAGAADQAASLNQFTPPAGDVSVEYLREIFGGLVDSVIHNTQPGAGQTDGVLGAMFRVYNGAVMFLGMLFVAYTSMKGLVDSAHDGEVLGKKMSSIWVPLRTVGGSALVLPLSSGYSLIQVVILWLAVQGAGIGDSIWTAAIDQLSLDGSLTHVSMPDSRPLAANILRYEVCAAAMNKQFSESGRTTRILVSESQQHASNSSEVNAGGLAGAALPGYAAYSAVSSYLNASYTTTSFSWGSPDYINPAVCGSLNWQESQQSNMGAGNTNIVKAPIIAAQAQAVRAMIAQLQPVAQQIVDYKTPAPGAIDAAAAAYENTIQAAAHQAIKLSPDVAREGFLQYARDGGWIYAGTWFNHIISLNDAIQSAVNTLPVSRPMDIEDKEAQEVLLNYQSAMTTTDQYLKNRSGAPHAAYDAEVDAALVPHSWDDFMRLLSLPALKGIETVTTDIAGSNLSPVSQLRVTGNDMVTAGVVIQGAIFTAAGIAGARGVDWTVGNLFDFKSAIATVSSSINILIAILWATGLSLAYYLPATPYIAFMTGVARWLVSVFEAVLAGPILAVAHIPEGDDAVGKAGPGYMLILAMVIQPALMLFALVASIAISKPLANLVNQGFMAMVSGITAGSFTGLLGFVALCAVYTVIMITVLHVCFGLIHSMPEQVMRFIGGAVGGRNIAEGLDKEAGHSLSGGTDKAVGGLTSHGMGGSAGAPAASPSASANPLSQAEKDRENAIHLGG